MKYYNLEVEELREFQGGRIGYFSKGHHAKEAFIQAVADFIADNSTYGVIHVRHEWWRCVPAPGEHFTLTVEAQPNARGAFPVTVVE